MEIKHEPRNRARVNLYQSMANEALTAFAFIHRDDLQIVAGRFQHQRFVRLAGYSSVAIAQFESQRKCHSRLIVTLNFDINPS